MLHLPTLPTRSWWSVRVRGLLRRPVLFSTVLGCTVPFCSVLCCSVEMKQCALFQGVLTFQTYLLLYQDAIFVSWRHQYLFQRPPAIQKPLKWRSISIHVLGSWPVRSSCSSIISVPAMGLHGPFSWSTTVSLQLPLLPYYFSFCSICDTCLLYLVHIIVQFQAQVLLCSHSC